MPSLVSILLREEIRLLKPIINKLSIEKERKFQDRIGSLKASTVASKVDFECFKIYGVDACFAAPKNGECDRQNVLLYLHGGGYVSGHIRYAKGFAGVLAAETKKRVLSIAYRLAPENAFPAAVEDGYAAYEYLLENGYAAENISLIGESAGGGLVYSLCLMLKEKKMQMPSAVVSISPWADLTFSGEAYRLNKRKDPALTEDVLRQHAEAYAQGMQADPLVSPVFGDLCGLPPSLIFAGSDELLIDDARMLERRLRQNGSECELVVEDGLWHVYVLFNIPEAKKAIKKITGFLERCYE